MKSRRFWQIAMIVGCALPVLFLLFGLIRGEKDISEAENRTLAHFPKLTLSSFLSGDFQSGLEGALGDQYPLGDSIKGAVLAGQNAVSQAEGAALQALFPAGAQSYAEITPGYYHFAGDAHRIVEKPWAEERLQGMEARAALFNATDGVRKYVYFIRNSRAQDFSISNADNQAVYDRIRAAYRADGYACFSAADYAEFCSLFYQTDHHWNHRGADRGYREILALLGLDDKPVSPEKEWTFDVVFNGSYARQTKALCADEFFCAYSYPLGSMKITLSGKRGQYGHRALYEKNRFPTDELRNHYAYYYGGDYGEILIDNGHEKGRNLLLIADSYSNPLNLLLASHFDQTCVIDLRYYKQDMGEEFDWARYAAEHGTDTVLMLGDVALFAGAQEKEGEN